MPDRHRTPTRERNLEKRARRAEAKGARERELHRRARAGRLRTAAVVAVAIVGLAAFGSSLIRTSSAGVDFSGDLRPGGNLESLSLPRLEGDGAITYAELSERPLVLNFFASWCPSCIAEMPDFERVHQRLGGRVAFLGVSQSDPPQASLELVEQTGITYPTAIDRSGAFFRAVGGLGMPTTVFIRPGGEIVDVWVGQLDAATLERLIEQHLGVSA